MGSLKFSILLIVVSSFFLPCHGQNSEVKLQKLFETIDSSGRLIGTISISKSGENFLRYTFGNHLKSEVGEELLPDRELYNMRIGTLSQVFTAVIVFQFIDEGKLSSDMKVSQYFPEIPHADNLTIGHLLTQSSGLHNIERDVAENIFDSWYYSSQSEQDLIQRISSSSAEFMPGDSVAYSSSNYILLAMILEKISGENVGELLRKRIFIPCEMDKSVVSGSIEATPFEIPSFYRNEMWLEFPSSDLSGRLGDASVISNSTELSKFFHALFSVKLISKKSLDNLLALGTTINLTKDAAISTSGIGYTSYGGIENFSTSVLYVPEDSTCLVITLAGINYPMSQLFWKTIELYYGLETSIPDFSPIVIPARSTKKYSGKFVSADGITIEIVTKDEEVFFELNEKGFGKLKLEALDENWFQFDPKGIMIRFGRNEKNKIDHLLFYQGRETVKFSKIGN